MTIKYLNCRNKLTLKNYKKNLPPCINPKTEINKLVYAIKTPNV